MLKNQIIEGVQLIVILTVATWAALQAVKIWVTWSAKQKAERDPWDDHMGRIERGEE